MEEMELLTAAIISLVVVSGLFWIEYKVSGCGYGGSNSGRDNWALRLLRKQMGLFKRLIAWVTRRPNRDNDYSKFQDVFGM